MSIPLIIHQIWIGPNKKPDIWMKSFSEDYIKTYPEWKYRLWNETNIEPLFKDFPHMKLIYDIEETYNGKSDILRYLILYYYGGIYVDADSLWINKKDFKQLIQECSHTNCFVSHHVEDNTHLCGGVIGSTVKHDFILFIIQNLNMRKIDVIRKKKIHGASTLWGPGHITKCSNSYKKNITIFPSIYFYPISWHGIDNITKHNSINLPKESYTFQYGYSTNNMKNKI